ncbi:MAG: aminomethyl-transferring glycine dehydrogenase subunit GcvPA [Planctomycetes bacterium]|nr:aminomethyl-transferring glycine dehydrogenase subunit GcvPA [Planctomycetota bacterium]
MSYIPHTDQDIKEMLAVIGVKSIPELFQSVPSNWHLQKKLNLPPALSELALSRFVRQLAEKNISAASRPSFLGAGCYHHFIPAVVDHLAGRSEFYTSYTPYQSEASQGNLQAFFEYQTMICELTGMEVANASVYDGATALAEAVLMSLAVTRRKKVLLPKTIHPEYRQVVSTYLKDLDIDLREIDFQDGLTDSEQVKKELDSQTACVAVQNPNFFGLLEDGRSIAELVHQNGGLMISLGNPISLGLLQPPGEYADIVVGEGQPLGNEMYFGGPHLGFFATKKKYVRKMPGRLVGQTVDTKGRRGFVLTLSAREQHIRRAKATSNICSNEALCALRAGIYLSALGKKGLPQIARLCFQKAHYAAEKISKLKGFKVLFSAPFFNEFVIQCPKSPAVINKRLLKNDIIGGLDLRSFYPELKNTMLFCVTEMNTKEEIDRLVEVLKK